MESKVWYKSKTIWTNVVIVLIAVLMLATEQLGLSPEAVQWILFLAGVLGIVLRALTDQPITTKSE